MSFTLGCLGPVLVPLAVAVMTRQALSGGSAVHPEGTARRPTLLLGGPGLGVVSGGSSAVIWCHSVLEAMHGALLGRRAGLSWENRDAFRVPSLGAVLPFGSCGAGCEDGTWGQRGPQSLHPAVLGLLKGRMQPGRCGVHGALLAAGGRSGTAREAAFPAAMPSASSRGHWRPGNEAGALGSILHAPPFPSLPPRPNTETRFCSSSVSLSVVSRVHVSARV